MNLQEFAKLKKGDRVVNDMTHSTGEIIEATAAGVRVRWGAAPEPGQPEGQAFHVPVNSTTWFHWSLVGGDKSSEHAGETPEQEAERLTRNAT